MFVSKFSKSYSVYDKVEEKEKRWKKVDNSSDTSSSSTLSHRIAAYEDSIDTVSDKNESLKKC